jgi:hypothetical protein
MMYDEDLDCGVLSDFDLSISRRTDRTGTIPFMAIELLPSIYWQGDIERKYRHELEAFIWVLPFVFLRYQNGQSQRGTPVDVWMTDNYHACAQEKSCFRTGPNLRRMERLCQSNFKDHWHLATSLLFWLHDYDQSRPDRQFQGKTDDSNDLASIWLAFVQKLKIVAERFPNQLGYLDTLVRDIEFDLALSLSETMRHEVNGLGSGLSLTLS